MSSTRPLLPSRSPTRRRSLEDLRIIEGDQLGSFACDCGFETSDQQMFDQHQRTNCQNRVIRCSFCSETFPTTKALGDHLIQCGNKTDQCPVCYRFIRRAHFTYHYENNCASVDEDFTPPTQPKSVAARVVNNSQQPIRREDVEPTSRPERSPPPPLPVRFDGPRTKVSLGGAGNNSPLLMECPSCRQRIPHNEFDRHQYVCSASIARRMPLKDESNRSAPREVPREAIPCELCNQSIETTNYRTHLELCRQNDKRRILERAKSMEREPVVELIPCEYCDKSFRGHTLQAHQKMCPMNPANQRDRRNPASGFRPIDQPPARNPDRAHYQMIDADQTRIANQRREPSPVRRIGSREAVSEFVRDQPRPIDPFANTPDRSRARVRTPDAHRSPSNGGQAPSHSGTRYENVRDGARGDIDDQYEPFRAEDREQVPLAYRRPADRHIPIKNRPDKLKKKKKGGFCGFCGFGGKTGADDNA